MPGSEQLAGTAPAILVACLSSVDDTVTLATSATEKLHIVVAAQAQVRSALPHGHSLTVIDPNDTVAVAKLLADAGSSGCLAVFPQMQPSDNSGFGKLHELAMLLGARYGGDQYVPVHVDSRNKVVTASALCTMVPPAQEDENGLAQWRLASTRKLIEEAHFACADLTETVPQMVLRSARTHGMDLPIFRQVIPEARTITNKLLLRAAFALGAELARRHTLGERVGLMLPTSAGTAAVFFATHFAGVVPVLLNFGAGNANLVSACITAQVKTVYSATALLQKLDVARQGATALQAAGVKVVMLEQLRAELSLGVKLGAVAGVLAPQWRFAQLPGSRLTSDDEAVVLFTSGSEGAPKGVVLSHRNIVANAAQILCRLAVSKADLLFNSLPVFHAFGMMGGMVLPVAAGIPSLQFPSPLLYQDIPKVVASEKATIFFSTSTFFAQYAKHGQPSDFTSLRLIIAGGEKLKESVRATWRDRCDHEVLEAYGVTEAAPGLAINVPLAQRDGSIGMLLPGVQHRLVPAEGIDADGSLLVAGANVMKGYLYASDPGVLVPPPDGWHDTGDIVNIDAQGFVWVVGRKKRFAKIAGEMVPLGRLEELFAPLLGEDEHAAVLTLADERRGEQLVLVTTSAEITHASLLGAIRVAGLPELWVPRRIQVVKELPLLATGKTDYPAVFALLEQD